MSDPKSTMSARLGAIGAAAVLGVGIAAFSALPAHATGNHDTTEVFWLLPATVTELPTGNTPAIWPQEYLPGGEASIPCDRFAQADVYKSKHVPALIADGILHEGEDYDVVLSWRFIAGAPCEEPPVEEPTDVCLNIDGIQETIPEGMEAGPAHEDGPTCVPADEAIPGEPEEELPPALPLTDVPTLAHTGPSDVSPFMFLGGLGALLLGVGLTIIRKRVA